MQSTERKRTEVNEEGNLTGVQTAPKLAEELIEGAAKAKPSSKGGPEVANEERAVYIGEGFPIGSMPGLSAAQESEASDKAVSMAVFLDKLSERLAFERMGTRLYDGLINKVETLDPKSTAPSLDELKEIRDEEHRHFLLLNEAVTDLGGDPTVMSPCADVASVASHGIMQVIMDPRTTVTQCLDAILTAELTDNAGWEMLIDLADDLGHPDLAEKFKEALEHEERHLVNVKTWLSGKIAAQAAA